MGRRTAGRKHRSPHIADRRSRSQNPEQIGQLRLRFLARMNRVGDPLQEQLPEPAARAMDERLELRDAHRVLASEGLVGGSLAEPKQPSHDVHRTAPRSGDQLGLEIDERAFEEIQRPFTIVGRFRIVGSGSNEGLDLLERQRGKAATALLRGFMLVEIGKIVRQRRFQIRPQPPPPGVESSEEVALQEVNEETLNHVLRAIRE